MATVFDISTLSQVKNEIDLLLKRVRGHFVEVHEKLEAYASLRFTLAYLNQVNGKLEVLGLEGCKRHCSEIEALTSKLEKHEIVVNHAVMAYLIQALDALSHYLQDLLNGRPDRPIKLYESLKPLLEVQGEVLEVSDLFYPDTRYSAPKNLALNAIAEEAIPTFVSEQRTYFQKSLLAWLRTHDADALANMRLAIFKVQQVPQRGALNTLWWVATAFIDALAQPLVAESAGAKKLCRKLDQQLRSMSMGDIKVPLQLLRNALYYVAISDRSTEAIANVKEVFQLDGLLPEAGRASHWAETEAEYAALAKLKADLPHLKDLWSAISGGHYKSYFVAFSKRVDDASTALQGLSNQHVLNLMNAVNATMHVFHADESKFSATAGIEIAASLNFLEYASTHYQQMDVEELQKMTTQTARLQSIIEGVALINATDTPATLKFDASVIEAVRKQVMRALQLAENPLDTFFRNLSEVNVLNQVSKPLQHIAAAFNMLKMPTPSAVAQLSAAYVTHFRNHANDASSSAYFALVAESLNILRLYAEALPNVGAELEAALAGVLQRLAHDAQVLEVNAKNPQAQESTPQVKAPAEKKTAFGDITEVAINAELQNIFLIESEKVQAALAQNLQALRVNATDSEALLEVRCAYHTLKDRGNAIGLAGMSAVAWSVEKLLSDIIECQAFPTSAQLAFVEKVSAAFASWSAALLADSQVTFNPQAFEQEASALAHDHDATVAKLKPQKEAVLIAGTRKLNRTFYNTFLAETQQYVDVLKEAQLALKENIAEQPSEASICAAHVLGSNALAAGFSTMGDLARAMKYWLDGYVGAWSGQHIALYGNVVNALAEGLAQARALKNPKSSRALIAALMASAATMQVIAVERDAAVNKEQQATNPSKTSVKPTAKAAKTKTTKKSTAQKVVLAVLAQQASKTDNIASLVASESPKKQK